MSLKLIDAYHLRSKISHKYESEKYVNEILNYINHQVKEAGKQSKSEIIFKLPSQFVVGKLSSKEAMNLIHGTVCKKLEEAHYDIQYKYLTSESLEVISGKNEEGAWIKISWKDIYEDAEIEEMANYLKKFK